MIFRNIIVLFLIPFVATLLYFYNKKSVASRLKFSSGKLLKSFKATPKLIFANNLFYLRIAALTLFIFALARPQMPLEESKIRREGIDIVLAIDTSTSMLAEDFTVDGKRQNRLDAVKDVIEKFIGEQKDNRIGMVAFARRAYTVCPLTLDYDWLIRNLERVKIGSIEDGTAIGSAIASALNRLEDSSSKSKIIILLTDGVNNAGKIPPAEAAEAAKALSVKIYTIGAGTKGLAPYPVRTMWGDIAYQNVKIEIDERLLKNIAKITDALYFRATDTKTLERTYDEIDRLEKTPIEDKGYQEYKELFPRFLLFGLLILLIEILLANTLLRKIP